MGAIDLVVQVVGPDGAMVAASPRMADAPPMLRGSRPPPGGSRAGTVDGLQVDPLDTFRVGVWRRGIDRKVAIVRDAYTMLNAEAQARRGEVMELIVIALIALEILLALVRH